MVWVKSRHSRLAGILFLVHSPIPIYKKMDNLFRPPDVAIYNSACIFRVSASICAFFAGLLAISFIASM